jgi:hypothetical protein
MPRKIVGRSRREPKPPSDRKWEKSALLEPRLAPRYPEFVSDGASLPFPPAALLAAPGGLDTADPAVDALVELLWTQGLPTELDDWRVLIRTEDEAVFGRGLPPGLVTVGVRRDARHGYWVAGASSVDKTLIAARDGIRASAWRLDPTSDVGPEERTLRVLVAERTFASGQNASRRVLPPDVHLGEDEIILRVYVKPRPGFQTGSRNPETPVRIVLPEAVGGRKLIDGALAPHGVS